MIKVVSKNNLSSSMEDYLEAIYILSKRLVKIRIIDIANFLRVKKSSVNSAVKKLSNLGLLKHENYGAVYLTSIGKDEASIIFSKHKVIRSFFIDILKIEKEIAERDACSIEHVVSEDTMDKLTAFVKFFKLCSDNKEPPQWHNNFLKYYKNGALPSLHYLEKQNG